MSNTINPYDASRPNVPQRSVQSSDFDEESSLADLSRTDASKQRPATETDSSGGIASKDPNHVSQQAAVRVSSPEEIAGRFDNALEGAIDKHDVQAGDAVRNSVRLEGLSPEEQNMIYRYFPESPNLALRLYKSDLSTNKVDPGSVGSRVDLRG